MLKKENVKGPPSLSSWDSSSTLTIVKFLLLPPGNFEKTNFFVRCDFPFWGTFFPSPGLTPLSQLKYAVFKFSSPS